MFGVLVTKVNPGLILTFAQFYDPSLHCFMFQDFLLAPTLEEFAHIVHIPVRDQVPYVGVVGFPEVALVARVLHLEKNLVESNLRTKGNVKGFTSKFIFEKATLFASSGSWDAFSIFFALLVYGLVLFPNIEGFVDKTVVTIFISRNPVSTLLADAFIYFHWRNQKRGGTINCYIFCSTSGSWLTCQEEDLLQTRLELWSGLRGWYLLMPIMLFGIIVTMMGWSLFIVVEISIMFFLLVLEVELSIIILFFHFDSWVISWREILKPSYQGSLL